MRCSRRLFAAALTALAASACLSPTLPLPPPARPSVEGPNAQGEVRLSGGVTPGNTIYALNPRTRRLTGQRTTAESGRYELIIGAQVGDELELWQSQGTLDSSSIFVQVLPSHAEGLGGAGSSEGGAGGGP